MYSICVCKRGGKEEGEGDANVDGGGCSLGICFPGSRKEVVSIKNTNNEIALTVIPFSLTWICWVKYNKSSSFYEAIDRREDKPLNVGYI